MSSAVCFILDQSKILSSDNGLKTFFSSCLRCSGSMIEQQTACVNFVIIIRKISKTVCLHEVLMLISACKTIDNCDIPTCSDGDRSTCLRCAGEVKCDTPGLYAYTKKPDNSKCQSMCFLNKLYNCAQVVMK